MVLENKRREVTQSLRLNMRSRHYQKKFDKSSQESKLKKSDIFWSQNLLFGIKKFYIPKKILIIPFTIQSISMMLEKYKLCSNFLTLWKKRLKFSPTLPSSVHCPIHLHTGPAPSVYTAFLLMPCKLRFEPATMVSQDHCAC